MFNFKTWLEFKIKFFKIFIDFCSQILIFGEDMIGFSQHRCACITQCTNCISFHCSDSQISCRNFKRCFHISRFYGKAATRKIFYVNKLDTNFFGNFSSSYFIMLCSHGNCASKKQGIFHGDPPRDAVFLASSVTSLNVFLIGGNPSFSRFLLSKSSTS